MELVFKNEYGTVKMGGGKDTYINIIEISGLGVPAKNYNTATYPFIEGQRLLSEQELARTITISATIKDIEFAKIAQIFYYPCELFINLNFRKRRKINCRCVEIEEGEKVNRNLTKISAQFVCDNPFFTDFYENEVAIAKRANATSLTNGNFTLPLVFTSFTTEATVELYGDLNIYPQIEIKNNGGNQNAGLILIENLTTDKFIAINYAIKKDEIILFDLANRKITSDQSGNIIKNITDDTILSDFKLEKGVNQIKVSTTYPAPTFWASIKWYAQFLEALR
jgi:hypothetical protein